MREVVDVGEVGGSSEMLGGQVGLGVDIVEIARMKAILARTSSFAKKVFSEAERAYCEGTASPEAHFATRFAAKEAVLKALGTGFSGGIGPCDVEVRRTAKGRPYVVLHGEAKRVASQLGVRELPLSLSYTHDEAVACAMAITDSSVRASEERKDPMEELARRFKEARGMLDNLEAPVVSRIADDSAEVAADKATFSAARV
ncbi:holo-ACP synthase [Adlercreutzia sp. ZJ138]|uniref:holo-ACP synthase n=1 Tax=Adlercreutzia sp. ZJ138 TaxID=2709405 RepID=UPI0013EA45FE|nr:holo-ACP synthase [Adlercreutzia sp. ZJ138]